MKISLFVWTRANKKKVPNRIRTSTSRGFTNSWRFLRSFESEDNFSRFSGFFEENFFKMRPKLIYNTSIKFTICIFLILGNLYARLQRCSFDQSLIRIQELSDKCCSKVAWQPQEQTKIDSKTNAKKVSDRLDCAKFIQTHKWVCVKMTAFWGAPQTIRCRFRSSRRNS